MAVSVDREWRRRVERTHVAVTKYAKAHAVAKAAAERDKVRENRLRTTAFRRGLVLAKSRRRDPEATDFGLWTVTERRSGVLVASGLTTDELAARLGDRR